MLEFEGIGFVAAAGAKIHLKKAPFLVDEAELGDVVDRRSFADFLEFQKLILYQDKFSLLLPHNLLMLLLYTVRSKFWEQNI